MSAHDTSGSSYIGGSHHVLEIEDVLKWSARVKGTPPSALYSNSTSPTILPDSGPEMVLPLIGRALNTVWSEAITDSKFLAAVATVSAPLGQWTSTRDSRRKDHKLQRAIAILSRWPEKATEPGRSTAGRSQDIAQAIKYFVTGDVDEMTETAKRLAVHAVADFHSNWPQTRNILAGLAGFCACYAVTTPLGAVWERKQVSPDEISATMLTAIGCEVVSRVLLDESALRHYFANFKTLSRLLTEAASSSSSR